MISGGTNEENRSIVLSDFYSEELDNYRKIRIYLPESYADNPNRHYPVLYMHDGQNLFDRKDTPFKESWNVHKTADRLAGEGKIEEIILVGIDNNTNRFGEYCHYMPAGKTYGRMGVLKCDTEVKASGILYEKFIINTLKPYIDKHFRTLNGPENTALMGSSLGGLVTYFIGFRHPEVFGKLGVVSPAFNWADYDKVLDIRKEPLKIWMDAGEGEAYYVENTRRVIYNLLDKGFVQGTDFAYYQVPGAIHNEEHWAKRVALPLLFFFGNLGKPVSCTLAGRRIIGLTGMDVTVNPIVKYDSGFIMTDVNGKYIPEDPSILGIEPVGHVIPKLTGTTRVRYEMDGVSDTADFTVTEELSETVRIELAIRVPLSTPPQEKIWISAGELREAVKSEDGIYRCVMTVPRDWGYHFTVFLGEKQIGELDKNEKPVKSRIFQATEDRVIYHDVESWDITCS